MGTKKLKVFYGAAIQGAMDRRERSEIHTTIINTIKDCGCEG